MPAPSFPQKATMDAVRAEVLRARVKFPRGQFLLAALTEEVGELAQAFLQKGSHDEIREEAMQVAAVAIRIIEEGDSTFDALDDAAALP